MPAIWTSRFIVLMAVVVGAGVVSGQTYPDKPIRIVTSEVGGGVDFAARLIAHGLTGRLGQHVIVENRSVLVAIETVAKSPPQGYTLLVTGPLFWIEPLLRRASYDPVQDFSPVSLTNQAPNILVVHPSVEVSSVKELIALAKAKPGELNYASGPSGGIPHLAGELFKAMAGVNIVHIAYKGSGPALNALIAGQVQLNFATAGAAAPHLKSGRLKALAVTSAQPSALLPGLPTVAASGVPGYESVATYSLFAPAKTPAAIVNRLNQETGRVLSQADVKEKFSNSGVEVVASSPEELRATVKSETNRLGKLIKDAGIRGE